jgi:hypothetical protein
MDGLNALDAINTFSPGFKVAISFSVTITFIISLDTSTHTIYTRSLSLENFLQAIFDAGITR